MNIRIERKNGYVILWINEVEHNLGYAAIDRIEYKDRIVCLDLQYPVKGIKSLVHIVRCTGSIEQTLYY